MYWAACGRPFTALNEESAGFALYGYRKKGRIEGVSDPIGASDGARKPQLRSLEEETKLFRQLLP